MIVTRTNFEAVITKISNSPGGALDCETTGLRPYHGDRLFSIVIALHPSDVFYFNFQAAKGCIGDEILMAVHLGRLKTTLADPNKLWFLHNAKFDLAMLANENIFIEGFIHCTKAIGRVEYNEHSQTGYSLEASLERIGLKKDDAVEKYIDEKVLWDWEVIPGKKNRKKNKHYDRVPFEIIVPYAERDATGTLALGLSQLDSIEKKSSDTPPGLPTMRDVLSNERRLTKTIFKMERVGVRIDQKFCVQAASFEQDRSFKAGAKFRAETGRDYQASSKLFAEIFESERSKWEYTDKGNPSFDSEILGKFSNPAAHHVLELRDAKSKSDFYNGFIYHADSNGDVHPNFNPDGARHGRFSSSEPNFQNLISQEDEKEIKEEFIVRRAIIPRPGFILVMPDWDQMEYRFMLEVAARLLGTTTPLIELVKSGLDVHEATAKISSGAGAKIGRFEAKHSNFCAVYGGGDQMLADTINKLSKGQANCSKAQAKQIKAAIFSAAPEMLNLIQTCMRVAEERGFIRNWLGRRCYFPDKQFSYRAPNYLIAGGCADIVKVAMNLVDDLFQGKKSRLILNVHDELPCEIHESEFNLIPKLTEILEGAFISKFLPLTTSMEWSAKSLGDKIKGVP